MSTRSSPSVVPLRVELRGSRILCAGLSLLAGGCLAILFASALPPAVQWMLSAAVLVHLASLLRAQFGLRGVLLWRDDGWLWIDAGGERSLQLRAATVWPGLIVLRMRCRATGRALVFALCADSAGSDAQRRLRVCLRLMTVFERGAGGA